jgi:hypothetical protein
VVAAAAVGAAVVAAAAEAAGNQFQTGRGHQARGRFFRQALV